MRALICGCLQRGLPLERISLQCLTRSPRSVPGYTFLSAFFWGGSSPHHSHSAASSTLLSISFSHVPCERAASVKSIHYGWMHSRLCCERGSWHSSMPTCTGSPNTKSATAEWPIPRLPIPPPPLPRPSCQPALCLHLITSNMTKIRAFWLES